MQHPKLFGIRIRTVKERYAEKTIGHHHYIMKLWSLQKMVTQNINQMCQAWPTSAHEVCGPLRHLSATT